MDPKRSAQLSYSLPHSPKSNSKRGRRVEIELLIQGDTFTLVADFEMYTAMPPSQANLGFPAPRMTVNICKTFLNDTKNRNLEIRRQPLEAWCDDEINVNLAALCEAFDEPPNRRFQSHFVQQRRMK